MSSELVKEIEALLFSSGRAMEIAELSELVSRSKKAVLDALNELSEEYNNRNTALVLVSEGECWKLTVKEAYIALVRRIVTETELPKAVLETLAVIAARAPVLQSDIIKIRNNKAYEHIAELADMGFIVKEKFGRSYKLKLSQKFFDYFDISNINQLRQKFSNYQKINK